MSIAARLRATGASVPRLLVFGAAPVIVIASHGLRMLLSLVIIKAIAVHLGAEGLGQLGNFMSITSAMAVLAGGGIANGVAKYVADYGEDRPRLTAFLRAAILYSVSYAAVVTLVSLIFARALAEAIFASPSYWWLIVTAGLLQVAGSFGVVAVGIANGLRRVDLLAALTIPTYMALMPLAFGIIAYMGVAGGALSLSLSVTAIGIPGLFVILRLGVLAKRPDVGSMRDDLGNLARFSLMLLASAIFFPVAETLLRSHVAAVMGLEQAGLWQALTRLSAAYLGFFNVYLAARYMPMLSGMRGPEIGRAVARQLVNSTATFLVLCAVLFLLRDIVIRSLFSEAFLPLSDVLSFQLAGDCLRLACYVVGFLLVAKGKTGLYVVAELVQMALWVVFGHIAIALQPDLYTVTQFYALSYLVYFAFICAMTWLYRRQLL